MHPTRVAQAVHGLPVVPGDHLSEHFLYLDVKSVTRCQYIMSVVQKHDGPHLQNSGIDQAHIAHNANRRVCELVMAS
jgi:hypothetical protein